jgi:hypothetical protein
MEAKMPSARSPSRSPTGPRRSASKRRWSAEVTKTSDALDLEKEVFASDSPQHIAASLKRSAERSRRRKASPFRSAMSMLTFYINRAGKNLPPARRRILRAAKDRLRRLFHRPAPPPAPGGGRQ